MPRYKLTVEYDGTPYHGYQRQDNAHTVQGALEKAFRICTQEDVTIGSSGRTDTGVHALAQVCQIDLAKTWDADKLYKASNSLLKEHGEAVGVLAVEEATEEWDARFSALKRHYFYRILTRTPQPALRANRVWWLRFPLDIDAMNEAAQHLLGHHDFTTFRSTQCQAKSPERTLDTLAVTRQDDEIHVRCSARSFLHNQVRSLVGTLKMVGAGHWRIDDVKTALEARDRTACGPVAPACGLYFEKVDYPDDR